MCWRIFGSSVCKLVLFWLNCFPHKRWAYTPAWCLRRVRLFGAVRPSQLQSSEEHLPWHGWLCRLSIPTQSGISRCQCVAFCVAGCWVALPLGRHEQISTHSKVSWWQTKVPVATKIQLELLSLGGGYFTGAGPIHSNWITKTPPPSCGNSQKLETWRSLQGLQRHKREGLF